MMRSQGARASQENQMGISTPLNVQKVILTVPYNIRQLIDLVWDHLVSKQGQLPGINSLVITGKKPGAVQIQSNSVTWREYLQTTLEEAEIIIIHQLVKIVASGDPSIKII